MFDAVVGNPPYQEQNTNTNNHYTPLYHYFYALAEHLSTRYTLITPARFLFNAGATPDKWNQYMLSNPHIRVLLYTEQSSKLFDRVDIQGGIISLYYDSHIKTAPIGKFIPNQIAQAIFNKITLGKHFQGLNTQTYVQTKLNLQAIYNDYPQIKDRRPVSSLNDNRLDTTSFDVFHELFTDNKSIPFAVGIYGRVNNERHVKYISQKYLLEDKNSTPLNRYTVIIPKSSGGNILGASGLGKIEVLGMGIGHTRTFRTMGAFKTKEDAVNLKKYLQTKFLRFLVGLSKPTQDMPPRVFRSIPLQDFSNQSDIDWSKPVDEIDKQLYNKYGLTSEEIEYIENNIQPME